MKIVHAILFVAGMIFGWLTTGLVSAYEEQYGAWTATEKRQVIGLLKKIESHTAYAVGR